MLEGVQQLASRELGVERFQRVDGGCAGDLASRMAAEAVGAPALKVSTHRPSLDDVFLSLTGGQAAPVTPAAVTPAGTRELAR